MTTQSDKLNTLASALVKANDAEFNAAMTGREKSEAKREAINGIFTTAKDGEHAMNCIVEACALSFSHYRKKNARPEGDSDSPEAVAWRNGFGGTLSTTNRILKPLGFRVAASYKAGEEGCKAAKAAETKKDKRSDRQKTLDSIAKALKGLKTTAGDKKAVLKLINEKFASDYQV